MQEKFNYEKMEKTLILESMEEITNFCLTYDSKVKIYQN